MWHFVYILQNQQWQQYVGHTSDLHLRLHDHNRDHVSATANKGPWHIEWFCGFREKELAIKLEKHLKTGSGSAFRFKHFVPKSPPVPDNVP